MDLSYLPRATEGHMTPSAEVIALWKGVKASTNFKHIFEIGTNAGHSAAIILTLFDDVKVTSIDIGHHAYTQVAVEALKKKFGDRFDYIEMSTVDYYNKIKDGSITFPEGVDIINIDGDHSVNGALNDINLARHLKIKHILIDDFSMYGVPQAYAMASSGFAIVDTYNYFFETNPVKMALIRYETN
jgi:predicted O-methyltransferase YrrM